MKFLEVKTMGKDCEHHWSILGKIWDSYPEYTYGQQCSKCGMLSIKKTYRSLKIGYIKGYIR